MDERLAVVVLAMLLSVPGGITRAKGQTTAFWFGFLTFGITWMVAALRLARPTSGWALLFYGPGKLVRANERVGGAH